MNFRPFSLLILFALFGCQTTPEQSKKDDLTYFDLKGYFENEATRLSKANPTLSKTVSVNDASETRKLKISDWSKELEIFKDADINKAAWKGMFEISKKADGQIYRSSNEKIPVKELQLYYREDTKTIKGLRIIVRNTNMLYTSSDTLNYYPDSLYQVSKSQNILLLSKKKYQITAAFLF